MEAALVTATTGVLKPLLSKLTKLLEEEYVKLKGVRKRIKFLRDELSAMSPTLEMLANAQDLNPQMREWRDNLRELAYDLEDCVDAFMVLEDHKQKQDGLPVFKRFFNKLKNLKVKARHNIGNQIEELEARVLETTERHKRYDLAQLQIKSSSSSFDPRVQALYEDIQKLVGIDAPKKKIIELLTMETNNGSSAKLKVVPIVGCGGLGKTTLAKQVYDTIKGRFKCAAFVSISRTPDIRKILIHIADGVNCAGINTQDDGQQQLTDKLREHLKDKRYIVVIDDVWNAKDWEFIKLALPKNDLGSRIITTTRSVIVAKRCSSQVYEMEALSFDDSKRLFYRRAFGSENNSCYPHLEDGPEKILRRCGGLPLAIITVSGILTNELAKAEWDRVLNAIGSALAKKPGAENMTAILSLSYFDMPHHLRTCLLYLSMFPEDYKIEKQCLINRWIAEGFIHEKEGQTKYEIGEGYFNDLINRCMIQPINVKYGQAMACLVHDIILDYIKCKAAEENFVTLLDGAERSKYKVRRLCVINHNEENVTLWTDKILSQVRSFAIFGQPVNFSLLPSTTLRVLDQGDCSSRKDHHLPSIENMFYLKYLRLCSHSITSLPKNVGKLQHLQTLDIRGTSIRELPQSITSLHQLAQLYVDSDIRFPEGTIGKMHSLEELREYGIQSYEQGKSIQEFCQLTKLRTLKIKLEFQLSQAKDIHSYLGSLLSSCNLHNLLIDIEGWGSKCPLALHSWLPEASCSIRKLCIETLPICRVPNWMGSLGNLSVLELYIIRVRPEDVEILGEIPSLLFLILLTDEGTSGRIVFPGSSNRFRILKYFSLNIRYCRTSLEFEAGSISKLEHVNLEFNAHKMECLNGASSLGIQHLSSLNKVDIKLRSDSDRPVFCGNHFYNPAKDDRDDTVRFISRAINAAIETLPNRPTVRIQIVKDNFCRDLESYLRELNEMTEGLLAEWLKLWQNREEQAEEATDSETEQEDDSHENEDEERADEDKETSEKEVAQQDDGGSSN